MQQGDHHCEFQGAALFGFCPSHSVHFARELRFRRTSGFNGEQVRSRTRGIHYESRRIYGQRKAANEDKRERKYEQLYVNLMF